MDIKLKAYQEIKKAYYQALDARDKLPFTPEARGSINKVIIKYREIIYQLELDDLRSHLDDLSALTQQMQALKNEIDKGIEDLKRVAETIDQVAQLIGDLITIIEKAVELAIL